MKTLKITKKDKFEFQYRGLLIFINIDREKSLFSLRTTVFSEENFIPLAIRNCVEKMFEMVSNKKFPVCLEINEEKCSVDLVQHLSGKCEFPIIKLIKLFSFAARSWAPLLKKIAVQDLI